MIKKNDRARTSRELRTWVRPRLVRLSAGAAENGLSNTVSDGQFSTS